MQSILDQLDHYYALKRHPAAKSGNASAPVSLRHPNAGEFFQNMMNRQKSDTANGNAGTRQAAIAEQIQQHELVSA